MSFKVGDIVKGNGIQSGINITNMVGKIVFEYKDRGDPPLYSVEFTEMHGYFHNCDGYAKNKYGFNVREDHLLYANPPEVELDLESIL